MATVVAHVMGGDKGIGNGGSSGSGGCDNSNAQCGQAPRQHGEPDFDQIFETIKSYLPSKYYSILFSSSKQFVEQRTF